MYHKSDKSLKLLLHRNQFILGEVLVFLLLKNCVYFKVT